MMKKLILFVVLMQFFVSCSKKIEKPVKMALFFDFSTPSVENVIKNELNIPVVRFTFSQKIWPVLTHLRKYGKVHSIFNLDTRMLEDLNTFYLERLKPFINLANEDFQAEKFLEKYGNKTDPWITLLLTPSTDMTRSQRDLLYNWSGSQKWNCFSLSEEYMDYFPDLQELLPEGMSIGRFKGTKKRQDYTLADRTKLKFLFNAIQLPLETLTRATILPIRNERGEWVYTKLHKWFKKEKINNKTVYVLADDITEQDCQQLVVEMYKVLLSTIPLAKRVIYKPRSMRGQVDFLMNATNHVSFAVLYSQSADYGGYYNYPFPQDAKWQVRAGFEQFKLNFRQNPTGAYINPSVFHPAAFEDFAEEGLRYALVDRAVFPRAKNPANIRDMLKGDSKLLSTIEIQDEWQKLLTDNLSDTTGINTWMEKIRIQLKHMKKQNKNGYWVQRVLPNESYREKLMKPSPIESFDLFLKAVDSLQSLGELITMVPMEILKGNKKRKILPKQYATMDEQLDTIKFRKTLVLTNPGMITALDYINYVRKKIAEIQLRYNPNHPNIWISRAWDHLFKSMNSYWFDGFRDTTQIATSLRSNDLNFRAHLMNIFYYLNRAGLEIETPELVQIYQERRKPENEKPFSTDPTINGRKDKLWEKEANYIYDEDGMFVKEKNDILRKVYYQTDAHNIYIALEANSNAFSYKLMNDSLRLGLYFISKDIPEIPFSLKTKSLYKWKEAGISNFKAFYFNKDTAKIARTVIPSDTSISVGLRRNFMEISIPWETAGDLPKLSLYIKVYDSKKTRDFFPNCGFVRLRRP